MAEMLLNPTIGALAYPAYAPQQAGVIVAIDIPMMVDGVWPRTGVRIQMLNGKHVVTASPMDYVALADEHQRKADKFKTHARSLASMQAEAGLVTP